MKTFKSRKFLIVIIVILLLIDAVVLGFFIVKDTPAENKKPTSRSSALHEVLKKEVAFDTLQLQKFDSIREEHFKDIKPLFGKIRQAKENFYALIYEKNVPDSTITALGDSIAQRQKQLDLQMLLYFKEVRTLCTEKQLPLFDSSIKKVTHKMVGKKGRHGIDR